MLAGLALLLTWVCQSARVALVHGYSLWGPGWPRPVKEPPVKEPPTDVTPTFLTTGVLSTLRQADFEAHNILRESGYAGKISQMPVILTPLHFDRDPLQKQPSCQRSVVIRTFITSDFMTGVPATPGSEIPVEVVLKMVTEIKKIPGISQIMYDLTSKPPGTTKWE